MSKKGVSKIIGPKNPKIGEPATYKVVNWYPSTPIKERLGENVKWELFRRRSSGKYSTTNIIKKGIEATFVFEEKSFGHEFFVEGYLNAPEKKGDTTIHIVPQRGTPKISGLRLLDSNKQELKNKPKYGQTLYAEIKTQNLFNERIQLQVWERDTASSRGHNEKENTLLKEKTVTINLNGVNYVKIFLSDLMMKKAQGSGGAFMLEGNEHEYYLVVKLNKTVSYSYQTVEVLNEKIQVKGIGTNPPPKNTKSASNVKRSHVEEKENKKKEENRKKEDAVVVLTGEITREGNASKHRGRYYMYKVNIYNGIDYDYYLKNKHSLTPSETHELSRDAWSPSKKRNKKRYGSKNETPPGVYWMTYYPNGIGSKGYKIKISDTPKGDYIMGDNKREGIRIHHYSPHFSEGCITTGDNSEGSVKVFINKIPSLKKKSIRFIIEERKVKFEGNLYKGTK